MNNFYPIFLYRNFCVRFGLSTIDSLKMFMNWNINISGIYIVIDIVVYSFDYVFHIVL